MVGIFHSQIKLYLSLTLFIQQHSAFVLFLVLSSVQLGVLQLHGGLLILQEHTVHFVVISSILLLDYIA